MSIAPLFSLCLKISSSSSRQLYLVKILMNGIQIMYDMQKGIRSKWHIHKEKTDK